MVSKTQKQKHKVTENMVTHNNLSIPKNTTIRTDNYIECDGYDKISVNVNIPNNTSCSYWLDWSLDGENYFTGTPSTNFSGNNSANIYDVQAPYFKFGIKNNDTVNDRTVFAGVQLKG